MGFDRVRTFTRMAVVIAVVGTGVVWEAGAAQAASFTSPPTRLYMAPEGTTLFAGLVGVPIGTLEFGPGPTVDDVISGDSKDITVDVAVGPIGCDTINDQPVGVPDYNLDDCPRLQMDVVHGRLKLENATQLFRDYLADPDGGGPLVAGDPNPNDVAWRLPGGAIVSSIGGGGNPDTPNDPDGHTAYDLSGTAAQINAALDGMSYIPDDGYYYTNSAPEERLSMDIVSGDPNVSPSTHDVEIRVLDVNDAASLEGPASAMAEPQIELLIPTGTPDDSWPYASSEWTVADEDNDEVVDDDTGETLPDGADDKMLLVGYLDCPPEAMLVEGSSGFHFRGGSFDLTDDDIESLLTDFYDLTTAPAEVQTAVDALLLALDAIEPGLTNLPLATGNVFDYSRVFAGIDNIDVVAYALSQVHVLIDEPGVTCTLYTVVSDLGNNGLPLQYVGDPPTGVEVPWLGIPPIDIVETEITTGELEEIDVYFDAEPLYVLEGTIAEAPLNISPGSHPEFDIEWEANPRVGDPDVPGVATANGDFLGTFNNTPTIPDGPVASVVSTSVYSDLDAEGNETFTFDLVLSQDPPPGWTVTSSNPQRTVIILDDDDASAQVDSFTGEAVTEGDLGTTPMTFTIQLDKPADGTESVDVAVSGGTASNPADFGDPVPTTVTFAPGATSATVQVLVEGDTDDEGDQTIELTLSNPTDLTVPPANATATGTILDDDETRVASIADASVVEGDAGTATLSFTVSLNLGAKGTETLTVSTADGAPGATAPSDYTALTNVPVTFDPGQTEATVTVDVLVNGDTDPESDETFTATLSAVSNVLIGDGTAVGTITNDDILVTTDPTASVDENASSTFEVQITPAEHPPFTLTGTLASITATAGTDYDDSVSPITISVPADAATVNVPISALGDFVVDDGEQYSVEVEPDTDPANFTVRMGSPSLVTVTIDDVPPEDSVLSVADVTVAEGDTASVALTNSFPARACQVEVTTVPVVDGATPGDDYTAINGATFDANGDPILVATDDDIEIESDETFLVTIVLVDPPTPGCVIGDGEATVTITSDDVSMEVSIDDGTVAEGATADLTVHVTDPVAPYCAVSVTTAAVPPTSASDFTAISGAAFTANDVDTVTVEAAQDSDDDDGETFTVTLALTGSSDPRCVIVDGQATVTIIDDDGTPDTTAPTVTVNQAGGQADPTSVEPIMFTVVFSEPVIGFQNDDVTLAGTAGATTAVVTDTGDGMTFDVAVTGMTSDGTVIASVGAGRATDAAANANEASMSTDNTVTYDVDEGDTTAPTVTVNQAAGQADPTDTSPVLFTVVFSEPVTGFEASDLLLDGTAGPTSADVTGSGTTYTVAVSGMPGPGTVIVSVPAGAAVDGGLNESLVSTSTDNVVTYEPDVGMPLTIDVPDDIVRGNDPGKAGAVVDFQPATASGGTPPTTVTCDRSSGEFFPLGTTTVNCTATDSENDQQDERFVEATVTASFTITVVDTEPPVIADNPDLVRGATSSTGTPVTFPLPAATDNAGTPTVTCAPASGTQFKVGVSTVTCTATDGAGNTASSSFTVTVTSPGSGVPATGSDTAAVLLIAALFLAVGISTRRIARRT